MGGLLSIGLGIVGAVVGSFIPGVGPGLGYLAGSTLGAVLEATVLPSGPRSGKLNDLRVTSSAYGQPIPRIWGTVRVGGNIIWSNDLVPFNHTHKVTYNWTGAVALCAGPILDVVKIWAGQKLVYDKTGNSQKTLNIYQMKFRLYKGTEDQMPDKALIAKVGAANAQAHRGMAYVVFDNIPLEQYGESVPNWTFEVATNSEAAANSSGSFPYTDGAVHGADSISCMVDWDHNRVFITSDGDTSTDGLRAIKLSTRAEYFEANLDFIYGPASGKWVNSFSGGATMLGTDGFLYWVSSVASNTSVFTKVDPDTFKEVGSFGVSGSGTSSGVTGIIIPHQIASFQQLNDVGSRVNYMISASLLGAEVTLMNMDSMTWPGFKFITDEPKVSVCGGLPQGRAGVAWALGKGAYTGGGTVTPIGLYKIVVSPGSDSWLATYGDNPFIVYDKIATINPANVDATWTMFNNVQGPMLDPEDGNIIMMVQSDNHMSTGHSNFYIVKLNSVDGSVMYATAIDSVLSLGDSMMAQSRIAGGLFCWAGQKANIGPVVYMLDTSSGTVTYEEWPDLNIAGGQYYDGVSGTIVIFGTLASDPTWVSLRWGKLSVGRSVIGGVGLDVVVSEICQLVQLTPADIDVTDLAADLVPGYVIAHESTVKDSLLPLANFFRFDGVESDYKLKFVKRGHASIVTIPYNDLSVVDTTTNLPVQQTRVQEVDLPRQVALNFLDPEKDYQTNTAVAKRPFSPVPAMHSDNANSVDVPIVSSMTTAKHAAEVLLYSTWENREQFNTKLSWKYLLYDPTDVVTLGITATKTVVARISTMNVGADLSIQQNHVGEDVAVYTETTIAAYGGSGTDPITVEDTGVQDLLLIDSPLIRDGETLGVGVFPLYFASGGYSSSNPGLELLKSVDKVVTNDVGGVSSGVAWGNTLDALADVSFPFGTDFVNTVTVSLNEGTLSSCTNLEMLNGANVAALIKADLTVELIQYQTATLNANGTYTLSILLRGRRGTEVQTSGHALGDIFVALPDDTTKVSAAVMSLAEKDATLYYKGVPNGMPVTAVGFSAFAAHANPLKPYAPTSQKAVVAGSDLTLTWKRRTRIGGELRNGTGTVPLSETSERYEIDIYNGAGTTVLRTLTSTAETVTYLAANITTDFGGIPATLTFSVYQMSSDVGRGFTKKITVPTS